MALYVITLKVIKVPIDIRKYTLALCKRLYKGRAVGRFENPGEEQVCNSNPGPVEGECLFFFQPKSSGQIVLLPTGSDGPGVYKSFSSLKYPKYITEV